ncbi:unnamed protein product, partial [Discosporangium mesarthrocarpum]
TRDQISDGSEEDDDHCVYCFQFSLDTAQYCMGRDAMPRGVEVDLARLGYHQVQTYAAHRHHQQPGDPSMSSSPSASASSPLAAVPQQSTRLTSWFHVSPSP